MMILKVHPENPQKRALATAVSILEQGGVIVFPTDTHYGLGCDLHNKRAIERIYQIKKASKNKPLSFICSDFKELSEYAHVSNPAYRVMKRLFPGPYTFILKATSMVPRMVTTKQKTVGIRIPNNQVCLDLVRGLRHPIITTSVKLEDGEALNDPEVIAGRLRNQVELLLDSGICSSEPSTVIDFSDDAPVIVRRGKGDISLFEDLLNVDGRN